MPSTEVKHGKGYWPDLEIWMGIECTRNRIVDRFHDQLAFSGHLRRESDLVRFAELGVRVIRYPVLWEHVAPDEPSRMNWAWPDRRLGMLRELGLTPIAGLVHHGSGPAYTDLLSSTFVEGLAAYGRAVAERYPWIDMYTPVNEPLTTARFSCLYGHWYPHHRDDRSFVRALLNQCAATIRCMEAIRGVNPRAQLIQTEDLGKVCSTPRLAYQAHFENLRRWLSFDLLCGWVNRDHPMWDYLREHGARSAELHWFIEHACPPDVVGVNHYVTSVRYLDEDLSRYPACTHGGNGRDRYADVEAVRVPVEPMPDAASMLWEVWTRYRRPIAVTEVHLHSTREEQMRWLHEIWNAAMSVRSKGADVRAITAWSLLGAFDWDKLVTRCTGTYEAGVFDLRSPVPRPTALAGMIRDLASGRRPDHAVLHVSGWWRRPSRLTYAPDPPSQESMQAGGWPAARPILIVGRGTLGRAFARICESRGLVYTLVGREEFDIADPCLVDEGLDRWRPWAVINAAGFVRVDEAEQLKAQCFRENTVGAICLARACARRDVQLLTFSSDLVFDGRKRVPYVETDRPRPLGTYGVSKLQAERGVLRAFSAALVIRTSAFFGPWDDYNFVTVALCRLAAGESVRAAEDAFVSPTYVPDLVHASLDLLLDGESGRWHLASRGAVSWLELARRAARLAGMEASAIKGCSMQSLGLSARRPYYSVLGSERATIMPELDDALPRYLRDCRAIVPGQAHFFSPPIPEPTLIA